MVTGLKLRAAHFGALHSLSSVYSWQCLTVQMVNLSFEPDHNHVEIMSVLSPIMERYNRTNETLTVSNLSISIELACRGGGGTGVQISYFPYPLISVPILFLLPPTSLSICQLQNATQFFPFSPASYPLFPCFPYTPPPPVSSTSFLLIL